MFNTTSGRDDRDKVVITPLSSYETSVGLYDEERGYEDEGKNYDEDFTFLTPKAENPDHTTTKESPPTMLPRRCMVRRVYLSL